MVIILYSKNLSKTIKSQIRYCYVVLSLELYLFPISCFKEARRRKIAAIYKMLVIKECCKITKNADHVHSNIPSFYNAMMQQQQFFVVWEVVRESTTWGYFHNETIKTYPSHLSIAWPNIYFDRLWLLNNEIKS